MSVDDGRPDAPGDQPTHDQSNETQSNDAQAEPQGTDTTADETGDALAGVTEDELGPERVDRGVVIGRDVTSLARWSLKLLIVAAAAWVLWWILGRLWVGVFPVLLAIIVSTVLWPPVAWLRSKGVPAALAAIGVLLGAILAFFGVLAAIAPSMISQSGDLATQASQGLNQLQERASEAPFNIDSQTIDEAVSSATSWLQARGGDIASGVFAGASAVGSAVITLLLVAVLTFFFLKDGPRFLPFVRRHAGAKAGAHITEVSTRAWATLGGFIRTQAIVSAVDAIFIGIGLLLLGVPLAFALAVLTFFGGFIPIVGAFSVGTLSVLIALVAEGPTTALMVLALIIIVQQVEGNVLQPILQGKSMELHAGVILLAVAAGGTLFGIVGAFLAVPFAAVAAVVLRYIAEQIDLRAGVREPGDTPPLTEQGEFAQESISSA